MALTGMTARAGFIFGPQMARLVRGPDQLPHLWSTGDAFCRFMHNQNSDENNECNNKGSNSRGIG